MKSNSIKNVLCLFLIAISVLFINNISAQPYFFYTQEQNDSNVEDVYRINLSTGSDELFIKDAGRLNGVLWNSSQTILYVIQRFATIDIYNLEDTTKAFRIDNNAQSVVNIHDAPRTDKLLIDYGADDESYEYTVIYNRTTYEPLDTIEFYTYGGTFLSKKDNILYKNIWDTTGIFFSAYDLQNNSLLYDYREIENFSRPDHMYFDKIDGKQSKALYFMSTHGYDQQKYFVVNPDSGLYFAPISIPSVRSRGYLSVNANFVIIERVNVVIDDIEANIGHRVYTGEISIYDAITGDKITDLSLSPNGEILFFENYPNMFYYFNRTDHSVVPIDLTTLEHSESGLPVKLISSQDNLLQDGTLQYYDSGWQDAVDNGNGTFTVQTDQETVSLKMTYAGGIQQLNNVIVGSDTAVFQTVNTTVKLLNSQNTPFDEGTVKYYANGWKDLGTTVNGETNIELLPKNYSFRMSYAGASIDKQQGIDTNATVIFQTANTTVQLKDSQTNLLDGGKVKYYASGWKDFGVATNGEATKELLPKQYSFRMVYAGASIDKQQSIDTNATVVFQTVNTIVQLKDSQVNLLDGGEVKYYASGWKDFGVATNGEAAKELLPKNYSFRMSYTGASIDKQQDIRTDLTVIFQTVNTTVQLKDSQGNLQDNGTVQFYAGNWQEIGTTVNGEVTKELLPRNYSFRMTYENISNDKQQDIGSNSIVEFSTIPVTVSVKDGSGNPILNAEVQYYSKTWNVIGNTDTSGEISLEMLTKNITFRVKYNSQTTDKQQDTAENSLIEFIIE